MDAPLDTSLAVQLQHRQLVHFQPPSPATMASDTTNLSPIWQSLPMEIVQMVLHEVVSIHLWNIESDPFYPWDTLRKLNHQQRRRIEAVYRGLLLPHLELSRCVAFQPTPTQADATQDVVKGELFQSWRWDDEKDGRGSTDTIAMFLDTSQYLDEDDKNLEGFDSTMGWNKYVKTFPPGGLQINPHPKYTFEMVLGARHRHDYYDIVTDMVGYLPASHLPELRDDFDDDSIRVSSTQLIGALLREWKAQIADWERQKIWIHYIPLDRLEAIPEV